MSLIQEALRRQQQESGEGELKSGAPPQQKPDPEPEKAPEPPPPLPSTSAAGTVPRKNTASKEPGSGPQIGKAFFLLLLFIGIGFVVWKMGIPAFDSLPAPVRPAAPDIVSAPSAEPTPVPLSGPVEYPRPLMPPTDLTNDIVELQDLTEIMEWPNLLLDGVVGSGAQGSCLINGRIVRVGDEIQQVKVVAIRRDGIELEYHGKTRFVRVGSSTRK